MKLAGEMGKASPIPSPEGRMRGILHDLLRSELGSGYELVHEKNKNEFSMGAAVDAKKFIDLYIKNDDHCSCAIELKLPLNKNAKRRMYHICKDIRFLEQLAKESCCFGFSLTVTDNPCFHGDVAGDGGETSRLFAFFSGRAALEGEIKPETEGKGKPLVFEGAYQLRWNKIGSRASYLLVPVVPRLYQGLDLDA